MGTANFKSMTDFPLIVAEDTYMKYCPTCEEWVEATDKCNECGHDLTGVEAVYDDFACEYITHEMEAVAERLNAAQPFYKVSVESGYYSGKQFYVEDKYWHIADMDNEESQDEFGMCRSLMLRKVKVAANMIRRELRNAKKELGLIELGVAARFSNGETWYCKVA